MSENQRGQKGACVLGKTSMYDDLESKNSGMETPTSLLHFTPSQESYGLDHNNLDTFSFCGLVRFSGSLQSLVSLHPKKQRSHDLMQAMQSILYEDEQKSSLEDASKYFVGDET